MKLCGYCSQDYDEQENHEQACRHHPEFFFPYDIDKDGVHTKGWQCCRSTEARAPGCVTSRHRDDVRKEYRRNSIAYDYVVVDEDKDRAEVALRQERAARREQMAHALGMTELLAAMRGFIGKPVATLVAEVGEPVFDDAITNGVSGMVSVCHRLFFEHREIHWQVDTSYKRTPGGPVAGFTIESIGWFVDQDERDEFRANAITDLTGD